jgi:hypothetical protein
MLLRKQGRDLEFNPVGLFLRSSSDKKLDAGPGRFTIGLAFGLSCGSRVRAFQPRNGPAYSPVPAVV